MTTDTLQWKCGSRTLDLGSRTLVMGILNVTPDSFSDGGLFRNPDAAVEHGLRLAEEGADIIDIGGESTRPGAEPVGETEEIARTRPVVEALRRATDVLLSIDTRKAGVARRAVDAGADIINDVSSGEGDSAMFETVRATGAGVVLMHMQGEPAHMQDDPRYVDAVSDVAAYLRGRLDAGVAAGIDARRIALDPGIGFGKRLEHNLELLGRLPVLVGLGRPIVVGLSRKRFLGDLAGRDVDDRLAAGLGAHAYAVTRGAHIIRVHDVKEACDAIRVVDKLRAVERS